MTRKDFELIAEVISKHSDDSTKSLKETQRLLSIARDFSKALAATNPNFDSDRFLAACGAY